MAAPPPTDDDTDLDETSGGGDGLVAVGGGGKAGGPPGGVLLAFFDGRDGDDAHRANGALLSLLADARRAVVARNFGVLPHRCSAHSARVENGLDL